MKVFAPILATLVAVVLSVHVAHAQEDLTPPELIDVQFSPTEIDTSKGPQVVTVTIQVVDDLSGFHSASLSFRQTQTTQKAVAIFYRPLFSGQTTGLPEGYYQDTFLLPQYAAFGEWEMYHVSIEDIVGNRASLWRPVEGEASLSSDWPSLFNGFNFNVGTAEQQQPRERLFIPYLGL